MLCEIHIFFYFFLIFVLVKIQSRYYGFPASQRKEISFFSCHSFSVLVLTGIFRKAFNQDKSFPQNARFSAALTQCSSSEVTLPAVQIDQVKGQLHSSALQRSQAGSTSGRNILMSEIKPGLHNCKANVLVILPLKLLPCGISQMTD